MGVQALYHHPKTRIKLPGCNSEFFTLGRDTRQGCPLSPLLFTLALDPLATAIKQHPDISGFPIESSHFKLCMYADDVMLFLNQPQLSLSNLFTILSKFASISGLTINVAKSTTLPIKLPPAQCETLPGSFSFQWSIDKIPYLGIYITPQLSSIFAVNYPACVPRLWSLFRI